MRTQTFLVKADNDKEAVMRLPVYIHGGITHKGFDIVHKRFYDGATQTTHSLKHAINLEAFSSGESLKEAIEKYQKNIL